MSDTHVDAATNRQSSPSSAPLTPVPTHDTGAPVTALQGVQLDTGHGKTIIADTVVAKIAAAAAREVDGVHELVTMGAGAAIAGFAGRLTRSDQRTTGVSVEVGQREAAVDLNVTVEYGVNIPQVAEAVRQNIMDRVRSMTGLIVKEVNINAADLYFPEEQGAGQPRVQ
jgi:uncharacterized alkaline shock family protein YloU